VTTLERRYPAFDGLNLTWESLEGIVKHNGPLVDKANQPLAHYRDGGVPVAITSYVQKQDLELWSIAGLEAQVAGLADDIAYDAHDIDDGLRAGLFVVDDLKEVPAIEAIIAEIDRAYPGLDDLRRGAELVRELISSLIGDVVAEASRRIRVAAPASADAVRGLDRPLAAFAPAMVEIEETIKAFLYRRMYRHLRVMEIMGDAEKIVADLFGHYLANPDELPPGWLPQGAAGDEVARGIGDFIAGMTDRFALSEHRRLFDSTPDLR
jgi:dGTPase